MKTFKQILTLLLVLPLLTACESAGFSEFEEPDVTLVAIQPTEMTLFEQRYDVVLRIQNPNNTPLNIEGLNFKLKLNGESFAKGTSNHDTFIPALESETVNVDVTTTAFSWLKQIENMSKDKHNGLAYDISGKIFLKSSIKNVGFSKEGYITHPNN